MGRAYSGYAALINFSFSFRVSFSFSFRVSVSVSFKVSFNSFRVRVSFSFSYSFRVRFGVRFPLRYLGMTADVRGLTVILRPGFSATRNIAPCV